MISDVKTPSPGLHICNNKKGLFYLPDPTFPTLNIIVGGKYDPIQTIVLKKQGIVKVDYNNECKPSSWPGLELGGFTSGRGAVASQNAFLLVGVTAGIAAADFCIFSPSRGGHDIGPSRPIHLPGNISLNNWRTSKLQFEWLWVH